MIDTSLERPSTASLLSDALGQTSKLVGSELQLVRVEVTAAIATAIKAVVAIVVAAIFLIVALIFLLQGVVAILVEKGFSASLSSFMVGGGIALLALIAIIVASRSLSASKLKPNRAIRQIGETSDLVKDSMR